MREFSKEGSQWSPGAKLWQEMWGGEQSHPEAEAKC